MQKNFILLILFLVLLQRSYANDGTMSKIVFYREYNYYGSAIAHKIYVNGVEIAKLKNNSYFEYPCTPGEYSIQIGNFKETYMRLMVEANKTYYLRFGIRAGVWTTIPELVLVDSVSAYPAIYQGNMRDMKTMPVLDRPKSRLGFNIGFGGGFESIPMVTTTDGKESKISFGGGLVLGIKYGYEVSKKFDLAFDANYEISSLGPRINNGDVTFERWILSLTPSYIIPIGDGETMRIKLGGGIDGYFGNILSIDLSRLSGGFSEDWTYKNTLGYHLSAIFELNASPRWSFHYGLKWYTVSYTFESGGAHYPLDGNKLKEPSGTGLDFIISFCYHF